MADAASLGPGRKWASQEEIRQRDARL